MELRTKTGLIGAAALVALGGLWFAGVLGPSATDTKTNSKDTTAAAASSGKPRRAAAEPPRRARPSASSVAPQEAEPGAPPMPRSLDGTDIDGALRVGPDGRLVLGPEVLALFEYFFSASGEESDEVIRARIAALLRERLDDPAEGEALSLLDKYIGYREAARSMKAAAGADEDPLARLETIRKLRREHFGEEAASKLFGDAEREGEVAAERSRVVKDTTLSPEERDARLAELEAKLPVAAREAREDARRVLKQRADEDAMRASGATDEEIHRHRVETMGEEAAERLGELDRRRADWKGRVESFRSERAELTKRFADEGARASAEQKLLEESFTPEERLRVKAILKMESE